MYRHFTDCGTDAAVDQHLLEAPAGADDQHDRRGRRQALIDEFQDLLAGEAACQPECVHRQQQRRQQCHDRIADKFHQVAQAVSFWQRNVDEGFKQHQEHRQQHGNQGNGETR